MNQLAKRVDSTHMSEHASVANPLLESCVQIQLNFIRGFEAAECLTRALIALLDGTGSECGFVAELKSDSMDAAFLRVIVESELTWPDTACLPERGFLRDEREIRDLSSLPGRVITESKWIIENEVSIPLRRAVCEAESLAVTSFLGVPLLHGDKVIGVVGLVNRLDGYDAEVVASVDRLIETTSAILAAGNARRMPDIPLSTPAEQPRLMSAPRRPVAGADSIQSTERLWKTLVENTPDYVMLVDCHGRLKFLNHVNAGYDPQSVLQTTIFDYQPEQVHKRVRDALCRVFQTGESVTFETTGEGSPGESCHYECRLIAVHDGDSTETAMLIATDVTARKRAEAADAEHVALLDAVANGTTELIFVKDRENRLCFVNSAVARIHHMTSGEILGKLDSDFYPESTAARIVADDRRVMESGDSITVQEVLPMPAGERVYITTRTPWKNPEGDIVGVLGISQDVTRLKTTENKLNRSEHFLKTITDASPLIIYVFEIASRSNVYTNRTIAADLGYTPNQIQELGSSFLSTLLHPDDMQRVPALLKRWDTARDGEVLEQEYRMRHANGSWRWFLGRDTVFSRSDDGTVTQIIGTAQDITERVETQSALRLSEDRLRTILELDPECVKVVSREGRIIEMNRAGLDILEASSKNQLLNASVLSFIAPESREAFENLHERVCRGESGELEFEVIGLKGMRRRLVTRAVPIKLGSNEEYAHLAVTRDVTGEREAEALIAQQRSQLARFSRLSIMGQMAAAITHEITQPLTSVSYFSSACEILLESTNPDLNRLRNFVQSIVTQSRRASEILKRIRGFVCGGQSHRQRISLTEIIRESIDLLLPEMRSRRVQLECHSAAPKSDVWCDRVQIQQVIVNVLTNACDALAEVPESDRHITISTSVRDNLVITEIQDSGPGLSPEMVEHLFDPFISSKRMGMGLGLAICLDIMKSHKGDITGANGPDGGALFRFCLPLYSPAEPIE